MSSSTVEYTAPTLTISPVRISTMVTTAHLGCLINIGNLFEQVPILPYWDLTDGILEMDYQGVVKGTSWKRIQQSEEKPKKTFFFNQATLVIRREVSPLNWKEINIKLFRNGGVQMTGVRSEKMSWDALNWLISYIQTHCSRGKPVLESPTTSTTPTTPTTTSTPSGSTTHLIRASVQGIIFLVESVTGRVFTYRLDKPLYVGTLEKIPEEDKNSISKTNGCLATARVRYRSDIREMMAKERLPMPDTVLEEAKPVFEGPVNLHKKQTQLVNTDFSIGAKIRRDILYKVLSERYHLTVSYEPAIYQGVKTKYFYNDERPAGCPPGLCPCEKLCKGTGDGTKLGQCKKITISPFQTGQIIITGARTMAQINEAYRFMQELFRNHAEEILRKNYICPTTVEPSPTPKKTTGWIQHPSPRNLFKIESHLLVGVQ